MPCGDGQRDDGGFRAPEAVDNAGGLSLILGARLQVGAQPKGGREEREEHHS